MEIFIWIFIAITIFLIISFILIQISKLEKNKKIFEKIFKLILVVWIANIISIVKFLIKPNEMGYFDIIIIIGKIILVYALLELVILIIKSDTKKRLKILKIAIAIFIVWSTIFSVDYFRVKNDKLPLFCFKLSGLQDGGTIYYIGIGYKVIDFHTYYTRLDQTEDFENPMLEEKYICPWSTSYEEALEKVKEELHYKTY